MINNNNNSLLTNKMHLRIDKNKAAMHYVMHKRITTLFKTKLNAHQEQQHDE